MPRVTDHGCVSPARSRSQRGSQAVRRNPFHGNQRIAVSDDGHRRLHAAVDRRPRTVSSRASTRVAIRGESEGESVGFNVQVRQVQLLLDEPLHAVRLHVVRQARLPREFHHALRSIVGSQSGEVSNRRSFGVMTEHGRWKYFSAIARSGSAAVSSTSSKSGLRPVQFSMATTSPPPPSIMSRTRSVPWTMGTPVISTRTRSAAEGIVPAASPGLAAVSPGLCAPPKASSTR